MNCPNCNKPLQPHQRFCSACGTRVEALTSDVQQAADQWQPQEVQPEPQQAEWRPQEVQPEPQQAEWQPQSVQPEPPYAQPQEPVWQPQQAQPQQRTQDLPSQHRETYSLADLRPFKKPDGMGTMGKS